MRPAVAWAASSISGLVLARPGRSTVVSTLDARAVRDARDVLAAMHEVAVREAVPALVAADLTAMRAQPPVRHRPEVRRR